jgi:hypothetical protein
VADFEIPATSSAEVHVLHQGYVRLEGGDERVSGTVHPFLKRVTFE